MVQQTAHRDPKSSPGHGANGSRGHFGIGQNESALAQCRDPQLTGGGTERQAITNAEITTAVHQAL